MAADILRTVATSLTQFWTESWHQSCREIFIGLGSKPVLWFFPSTSSQPSVQGRRPNKLRKPRPSGYTPASSPSKGAPASTNGAHTAAPPPPAKTRSKPRRVLAVLSAFFVSGALHVVGLWGMGHGTEWTTVGGFFMLMGVGIVLEGLVGGGLSSQKRHQERSLKGNGHAATEGAEGESETDVVGGVSGGSNGCARGNGHCANPSPLKVSQSGEERTEQRRKGFNWLGWVWTMSWILLWGHLLVDGWFRRGLAGSVFFPAGWRPFEALESVVRRLVA